MGKYYSYFTLNWIPPNILIGVIAYNPCVVDGLIIFVKNLKYIYIYKNYILY